MKPGGQITLFGSDRSEQRVKLEDYSVCCPRCHLGEAGQGLGLQKMTESWTFCDISGLFFSWSANCPPVVISNHAVKLQKPMSCRGSKLCARHGGATVEDEMDVHTGARAGWAGAPGRPQKRGRRTKPVLVSGSQMYLNNVFCIITGLMSSNWL